MSVKNEFENEENAINFNINCNQLNFSEQPKRVLPNQQLKNRILWTQNGYTRVVRKLKRNLPYCKII